MGDRFRITLNNHVFSKGFYETLPKEIFLIVSVLKTNPWMYKIENLKREKIIVNFYKNGLLLSQMTYYPESYCYVNDKIKAVLEWLNYTTKNNLMMLQALI